MDIIQALEQYSTFLRDLAPMLKQYRKDLEENGFTKHESFLMTMELQKSLTGGGKKE